VSYSRNLIAHALELLSIEHLGSEAREMKVACERRAVSAAYYALFHHIIGTAASLIAPNVPTETNHRIRRWFDHAEMKKIGGRFLQTKLDQPLLGLVGPSASPELQLVVGTFIKLQDARHNADYDLSYRLASADARQLILLAVGAMDAWDRIANSAEANIFILSLLLWKNWEKERI
jgi:hypothetical protein